MDTGWKFSDEHGDYYRYEYNPGKRYASFLTLATNFTAEKNEYVIVWGRCVLGAFEETSQRMLMIL